MGERLLHVVGDSKFGGASVLIAELAMAAGRAGYAADVLTTDPVYRAYLRDLGVGTVNLDVIRHDISPMRDLRGARRLTGYLREADYSIVHTHTSKGGLVGRYAAWHAQVPFIVHTVHGFAFHEDSSPAAIRALAGMERLAARWCHKIVTVSEFHRAWALRLRIAEASKIVAIPNGVDVRRFPQSHKAPGAEPLLVTCGRLAPQKGLETLLAAMPAIHHRCKASLLLVGDGPSRAGLEALVDTLGLRHCVQFAGFQPDVAPPLASGDLAVLPSVREGMSIALLEAMAVGLPIVATSIGSNMEACADGQSAVLVPPADATALTDAVCALLDDPRRARELGDAAARRVRAHYTLDRMLGAYVSLYAEGLTAVREGRCR